MTSRFIGLVLKRSNNEIVAIVDPDYDHELMSPRWLLINPGDGVPLRMLKILRVDWRSAVTDTDKRALIEAKL